MSQVRDWFAGREHHEAVVNQHRAGHHDRDRERIDLEAEAANHGYDTTEPEARHDQERARRSGR